MSMMRQIFQIVLIGVVLAFAGGAVAEEPKGSEAQKVTFPVCEQAEKATDPALKAEWQRLCKAEQEDAIREAWAERLERNVALQERLGHAQEGLLRSIFCSQRPYPYGGLCASLGR